MTSPAKTALRAFAITVTFVLASACGSGSPRNDSSGSGASSGPGFSFPSGPVSLSIRQVFESNVPGNGPPGTDVTDGWSAPPSAASPAHSSGPIETEPSAAELAAYANLDCSDPANQKADPSRDDPTTFVAVCGAPDGSNVWYKYLLHPTLIAGPEVASAAAAYDDIGGAGWTVQLTFTSGAANTWSSFTARHIGTLTAIVLDGDVVSAEVIEGEITGPTQITGNFTKQQATALAKALKEGAASR